MGVFSQQVSTGVSMVSPVWSMKGKIEAKHSNPSQVLDFGF